MDGKIDQTCIFMMQGRKVVNGIGILDAGYIIPFKMYAWLDLKRRKESGEHVNDKDLKKHKNDVFRLLQIVPNGVRIECNGLVQDSVNLFLSKMKEEELGTKQMGLPYKKETAIELLTKIYEV